VTSASAVSLEHQLNSQWTTTVGELCDRYGGEIQTGPFGSQLHASDYSEDGTPVVMPQDMQDGTIACDRIARVPERHVDRLSQHALARGDVVYSRRGDVARFAIVTEREAGWLCGTGSIRIRLNCPDIEIGFVRHYLQQRSVGDWLRHHAKGVTMPNLNTSIMRALPFVYPPLQEQRRIAEVLDRAEALRAKRRAALGLLDTLTQSIFLDLFGDPIANAKRFPVKPLIDLIDPTRPLSYGILMPGPDQAEGVKYVRVVDMKQGGIDLAGVRKTTEKISNAFRRSLLKPGDLLMSIRGHVGRFAVVPPELDGANITQDTARLAVVGCSSVFIRECLRSLGFQRWMAKHTKGVAVRGINLGDIKLMPIIVPPTDMQNSFAKKANAVEKLKFAQRASLTELDALFASLQHRAFRGEL
jgi:type I restriction enzyme, S subunit